MNTHPTIASAVSFALLSMIFSGARLAEATPPDLSGVWQVTEYIRTLKTMDGNTPPLRPSAAKLYQERQEMLKTGNLSYDPVAQCIMAGLPRVLYLPYPFEIIQRPTKLLYLFQWNHLFRIVDLTNEPRVVEYPLTMGVSDGHWEGNTLVIDTIGHSDNTLLDAAGMPNSEQLHLVERLRLIDRGTRLQARITIDDPAIFTKPWMTQITFRRLPAGTEIGEDVCLDRLDANQPAVVATDK